jgi:transcriptional regulator with XRE-family HTH domain
MTTSERARDRGRRRSRTLRAALGQELRDARIAAGLSQRTVARLAGMSQSTVSHTERGLRPDLSIDEASVLCAILGLSLFLRAYPEGPPVRDAASLRLIERFLSGVSPAFRGRREVPVAGAGDLRAWDLALEGPAIVAVDAETRLTDVQSLLRRLQLKQRDSGIDCIVLLVSATRHNRAVINLHRLALASILPLGTRQIMRALRRGEAPPASGIVLL